MMHKKIAIVLCLLVLVTLTPVSDVLAKPKATIKLLDIEYTNFRPAPQRFVSEKGGLSFLADGLGTIDCNRVEACTEAGLGGKPVTIQQGFYWDADRGNLSDAFTVRTAGKLQLDGSAEKNFTGRGMVTVRCPDGTCFTTDIDANVKGGAKLILRLDIDSSSAGIIEMGGEGELVLGGRGAP
jgi:hypothetical protein